MIRSATKEEILAMREFIFLPFMLEMLENELRKLQNDRHPLQRLFIAVNETLTNEIYSEMVSIRKYMKEHNLKVVELDRDSEVLHFRFWCRGYQNDFSIMRFLVKSELATRFGTRIAEVSSRLK